jgi:hypothetical protein
MPLGVSMFGKRVASSLVTLVSAAGLFQAHAAPLDDAAERYRPYMIDGIGSALAGAKELRERILADDLVGARKA